MIKLSILITHYNESEEVVKPLIQSILSQEDINFNEIEVLVGNDGYEHKLPVNYFNQFNINGRFNVAYYIFEKKGISSLRNSLLELANGEYVMFCDCDDKFVSDFGISNIFQKMESKPDLITSCFYEEVYSDDKTIHQYNKRQHDRVFIHGKVIRKQFLIDNNIFWDNELTLHEDSYFNNLCYYLSQKQEYIEQPFYLWKWRDSSVVRQDKWFLIKTYQDVIKSASKLVEGLLERDKRLEAGIQTFASILNLYYMLQNHKYIGGDGGYYADLTRKPMREFYDKYGYLIDVLSAHQQAVIISQVRCIYAETCFTIESITFEDWIRDFLGVKENG